ncbi:MAG TPA: hypothetical protein VKB65_04560 [Myxococcota bacterium]|nr:hypothetical protein [Myxococcota bacterium]
MIGRAAAMVALAALSFAAAAGVAVADGAPGASLASACQLDFQLFCPDLDPESARAAVEVCLEANLDALTEECRAVIDPASVPRPVAPPADPLAEACRDDFQRLCGHEADRMAFARCVRTQQARLSAACRAALDAAAAGAGSGPP